MVMRRCCVGVKQNDRHYPRPKILLKFEVKDKSRWPFGWEILRELVPVKQRPRPILFLSVPYIERARAMICYDCCVSEKGLMDASTTPMKAIELPGGIDDQHRLQARVPNDLPAGPVRLIVLLPDEDGAGGAWAHRISREWAEELRDSRQDIYALEDGQPV